VKLKYDTPVTQHFTQNLDGSVVVIGGRHGNGYIGENLDNSMHDARPLQNFLSLECALKRLDPTEQIID
jgi:hypothetical protein